MTKYWAKYCFLTLFLTLMGYMIEGAGSKTYAASKKWLYQREKESNILLDSITDIRGLQRTILL